MEEKLKNNFSNSPKAKKILAGTVAVFVIIVTSIVHLHDARKNITIIVDGKEETFITYKGTVKDVLSREGDRS